MTDRDVRDLLRVNFEGIVERHGVKRSDSYACALELLAALDGQRIKLTRPAHLHDPNGDWRSRDRTQDPAAHREAGVHGARAARAAMYGTGTCPICRTPEVNLTRDGHLDDHEITDDALGPVGCVGAGAPPRPELSPAVATTATPPTTTKADT